MSAFAPHEASEAAGQVRGATKEAGVGAADHHCEIEYRAWTHDRKLRHASYKGLREVQDSTR